MWGHEKSASSRGPSPHHAGTLTWTSSLQAVRNKCLLFISPLSLWYFTAAAQMDWESSDALSKEKRPRTGPAVWAQDKVSSHLRLKNKVEEGEVWVYECLDPNSDQVQRHFWDTPVNLPVEWVLDDKELLLILLPLISFVVMFQKKRAHTFWHWIQTAVRMKWHVTGICYKVPQHRGSKEK